MTVLVSRNTIKLATAASAVNDYYVGYKVVLSRVDAFGKKTTQTKKIVNYDGASRVATIDSLWDTGFTPGPGDTYEIVPGNPDKRVSINPVMQAADYITSPTYGRGLNPTKDLKLDTWLESARICDTRSDIYVKFSGTAPAIGDVYILSNASIWQGTVAEVTGNYIRFTNILGKLSYKWNNYRNFSNDQLVYQDTRLYQVVSGGVKDSEPTHTSGSVNGLTYVGYMPITKTSGSGPATIPLAVDGNPVRFEKNGVPISGYTLYDSDGVDYYRYIGWDDPDQRSVTRHQTNISIDTSLPLFDNMNSQLQHFGGILRYTGDKYVLEVEDIADPITNAPTDPRNITADDIIGKISINDEGIRNSFNSVTASYADPANKFEARNISFFNSEYLKSDRNVPKKGSISIPGITNYYNARLLADKFLTRSRYGLTINMNLVPKGMLLLAGRVIQVQYPRYGWTNKKFRIENLTFNDDCTVDIVGTEYDPSFYVVSNIAKAPAVGLAGQQAMTTLGNPTNLVTTNYLNSNELISAIELKWTNAPGADSPNVQTEIFASYSPNMDINVLSITSNSLFTTSDNPHGLDVGQTIVSDTSNYGLVSGQAYYVKTSTPTTFTLSTTKDGPTLNSFTNTTNGFTFTSATNIATVNSPTNTYIDTVFDVAGSRVQKYYWIRHRINVQ